MTEKTGQRLRRLFQDEVLELPACRGSRLIQSQHQLFTGKIGEEFAYGVENEVGLDTPPCEIEAYETLERSDLAGIFNYPPDQLPSFCFTQSQILELCEKYNDKLRADNGSIFDRRTLANLFLYSSGKQVFGAGVHLFGIGLSIARYQFPKGMAVSDPGVRVWVPALSKSARFISANRLNFPLGV